MGIKVRYSGDMAALGALAAASSGVLTGVQLRQQNREFLEKRRQFNEQMRQHALDRFAQTQRVAMQLSAQAYAQQKAINAQQDARAASTGPRAAKATKDQVRASLLLDDRRTQNDIREVQARGRVQKDVLQETALLEAEAERIKYERQIAKGEIDLANQMLVEDMRAQRDLEKKQQEQITRLPQPARDQITKIRQEQAEFGVLLQNPDALAEKGLTREEAMNALDQANNQIQAIIDNNSHMPDSEAEIRERVSSNVLDGNKHGVPGFYIEYDSDGNYKGLKEMPEVDGGADSWTLKDWDRDRDVFAKSYVEAAQNREFGPGFSGTPRDWNSPEAQAEIDRAYRRDVQRKVSIAQVGQRIRAAAAKAGRFPMHRPGLTIDWDPGVGVGNLGTLTDAKTNVPIGITDVGRDTDGSMVVFTEDNRKHVFPGDVYETVFAVEMGMLDEAAAIASEPSPVQTWPDPPAFGSLDDRDEYIKARNLVEIVTMKAPNPSEWDTVMRNWFLAAQTALQSSPHYAEFATPPEVTAP